MVELDQRDDGASIQSEVAKITGQRTVPNTFILGSSVGGNDDLHRLHSNKKLKDMLKAAGAL